MARLLHRMFEDRARATPDGEALRHLGRSITYRELDSLADTVASSLRVRGIGAGGAVGLHVERSIDQVACVLGILKTDAAVVPLPPAFPRGRIREILDFAKLDLVVDAADAPLDPAPGTGIVRLEELRHGPGEAPGGAQGDPEQVAFVLCSSGSTGRPKLIARSHRSFFHRLEWTWERHPFRAGEVCCQKAHMTTTHSIYELFEPLLHGTPTVIAPDEVVRDLERFWELIREHDVSRILIVPSPLRASLAIPGFEPPPFEVVVIMGEYVHPRLAAEALDRFAPHTRVYSIYGSTEASSTLVCDLRSLYREGEELPLGEPISPDTRALVLGPDGRPVSPGEQGRLFIGGPALFTGYFRDLEATEAALRRPPDGSGPLYDTRDRVQLTADSELRFIGRVDHTVKVRGFRVNTQEVESVIRRHAGVTAAAVVTRPEQGGGSSLVAFVTPETIDQAGVFETLRDLLPPYMIPAAVVPVAGFPMTASAKLDRVRLLEELAAARPAASVAEELTPTERRVRDVWVDTLGHDAFDRESSYFEVGGSSLTVFALVHRLRQEFGLDRQRLSEHSVYRSPTVAELAARIDAPATDDGSPDTAPVPIAVRLRSGVDPDRPPLFVVASAGGTLGAYAKLAAILDTDREIVGLRDPLIWGGRDPREGFQAWTRHFLDAVRARQPTGPYYVCAYSSAGAFGYEIARRLRADGEEVALLALIEPLALDRSSQWRYGYWALRSTWMRKSFREIVRAFGWLRSPAVRSLNVLRRVPPANDFRFSDEEFARLSSELKTGRRGIVNLSRLMELNTGLPFALEAEDGSAPGAGARPDDAGSGEWLERLKHRVEELTPEVDLDSIERIAVQYQLQVRTHHAYRLTPYDGPVLLVEPVSPHSGILAAQLRPYVRRLAARQVELGPPSDRTRELVADFGRIEAHYRCMRDERFVRGLAAELAPLLK